jgi:CoA-disulfide reductase
MKVVIVGGVAGGATAAARIRRLDEKAEIVIFERSGYISYANCGLPYYIGGVITDPEELTLQTPESFKERFNVDVKVLCEVTSINASEKTVTVRDLQTGEVHAENYDKLVLAPGARPVRPNIPGSDGEKIFTLRTVEDTFRIRSFVEENRPESVLVVGGGFIGVEMAENLSELGIKTTIVQRSGQLLKNLDYDMASIVHTKLRSHGVTLKLNTHIKRFDDIENGVRVSFEECSPMDVSMVVLAIGVTPENALAKSAGLETGLKGAIVTNDRMQTSVPDIYAVGDAVQVKHSVSGKNTVIPLAGPANKQGRIAADNICGLDSRYKGSIGSFVVKIFDLTAAGTGLTEKAAREAGYDLERVVLSPSSHAGYYPGASILTLKVIFEKKTLKILGAQAIGKEGADKRIDVLAAAVAAGMRADELKDLDLAYAPPYSSAKDPVNMAGYMIENIAAGRVRQFHWDEVDGLPRDGSVTLLDVRTPWEYEHGHADGFINIPVDDLRSRIGEIDKAKPAYIMCMSGLRSYVACRMLSQLGFESYNFSGGYRFYSSVTREKAMAEQTYPCGMDK